MSDDPLVYPEQRSAKAGAGTPSRAPAPDAPPPSGRVPEHGRDNRGRRPGTTDAGEVVGSGASAGGGGGPEDMDADSAAGGGGIRLSGKTG